MEYTLSWRETDSEANRIFCVILFFHPTNKYASFADFSGWPLTKNASADPRRCWVGSPCMDIFVWVMLCERAPEEKLRDMDTSRVMIKWLHIGNTSMILSSHSPARVACDELLHVGGEIACVCVCMCVCVCLCAVVPRRSLLLRRLSPRSVRPRLWVCVWVCVFVCDIHIFMLYIYIDR